MVGEASPRSVSPKRLTRHARVNARSPEKRSRPGPETPSTTYASLTLWCLGLGVPESWALGALVLVALRDQVTDGLFQLLVGSAAVCAMALAAVVLWIAGDALSLTVGILLAVPVAVFLALKAAVTLRRFTEKK